MASSPRAPIAFPLPEDLTGSKIGRFIIHSRIGGGGMADVYYAEDSRLKRPVALKRVNRRLRDDPEARQHILREAQRASSLNSDHIASVYDVVEESGELLLVEEYVEGSTLRQRLRASGPLPADLCVRIATECAEALAEAHRKGIVHRDIKPENIILTPADHVKILDFGLALRLRTGDPNAITISAETQHFGAAGTPGYMAPEVLLGEDIDGRTDLFSLGVVLHEALTGQHPFATRKPIETAKQNLHLAPGPERKIIPNLPGELDRVMSRMIAMQATARYQTAGDLLVDLYALTNPAKLGTRLKRFLHLDRLEGQHRVIARGVALLLIGLTVWALSRMPSCHTDPTNSVLIADFDSVGDTSIPDKAIRELFTTALQQSRQINVLSRSRIYEALQRMQRGDITRIDENTGREISRRENADVLLAGTITQLDDTIQISVRGVDPVAGNALFTENERVQHKAKIFDAVDALAQRVRKRLGESQRHIEQRSESLAKVTTNSLDALQLYSQGMDLMARGKYEEATGLFKSATEHDPNFAMAHRGLSDCYSAVVGRTEGALQEIQRAYDLREHVTERERLLIEAGYYNLQEDYARSAQSLKTLSDLYVEDASAHLQLAAAYDNLGHFEDAIKEQRLGIQRDPNSTNGYIALVLWLARDNQNAAAIREYQFARSRGMESPYLHWGLGMAYLGQDDLPRAREQFESLSRGSPTEAELGHFYLAMADLCEGKLHAAETRLAARLKETKGSTAGFGTLNHYQIARIRLLSGDPTGAQRHAEAILAMPSTDVQVVDYRDAARILLSVGNVQRAQQLLAKLGGFAQRTPNPWNESSYRFLAGEISASKGELDAAQSSFEAALRAYPESNVRLALARVFAAKKDWPHAVDQYQQFLRDNGGILQHGFPPDLAIAHLELARVYREENDLARSEYEYSQVLTLWRNGDDFTLHREAIAEKEKLTNTDRK